MKIFEIFMKIFKELSALPTRFCSAFERQRFKRARASRRSERATLNSELKEALSYKCIRP